MRCGKLCEHEFVDVRTDRPVLPFVNVLAEPGRSSAMTRGGRYRCTWCHRIIDLTMRAGLELPEAPIDTRTVDPFGDWMNDVERAPGRQRRPSVQREHSGATAAAA